HWMILGFVGPFVEAVRRVIHKTGSVIRRPRRRRAVPGPYLRPEVLYSPDQRGDLRAPVDDLQQMDLPGQHAERLPPEPQARASLSVARDASLIQVLVVDGHSFFVLRRELAVP